GVYADGSLEAARIARTAEADGAAALLVFPPQSLAMGGQLRPEMAYAHFAAIAAATSLPLICFNYTAAGPLGYPHETLLGLVERVPTIRAVKDWCGDPMLHERNIRALQGRTPPVTVLTTHSAWLMSSLVLGCGGLLSGAGSVIAALQVALFRAVAAGDLAAARAVNERIYPLAQAFYAPPFLDMHNRMKEVLALTGKLPPAVVRPPLVKLPEREIALLRRAVAAAGLVAAETVLSHSDGAQGILWVRGHTLAELVADYGYDGAVGLLWEGFAGRGLDRATMRARLGAGREAAFARLGDWLDRAAGRPVVEGIRLALAALPEAASPDEILATLPVAVAALLRQEAGAAPLAPDPGRGTADDLLRMAHGALPPPAMAEAL